MGLLHLDLTLVAAGPLGEDIQDQLGAIEYRRVHQVRKGALLGGGKLVVEDDNTAIVQHLGDFQGLAPADEGARLGVAAPLDDCLHHV